MVLTADEKKKIEEQIQEQDEDTYGTEHTDGGDEVYADTEELVKDVTGNLPKDDEDEEEGGYTVADAVDNDEEAIEEDKPEDKDEEEVETEEEITQREEKYVKSHEE